MTYHPQDRVIVRLNPHAPACPRSRSKDALGTIERVETGFMGKPLYYVRADDWAEALPLNEYCLEPGEPRYLLQLAADYEVRARELRRLAGEGNE